MKSYVPAKILDEYRKKLKRISDKASAEIDAYMLAHNYMLDDGFITYAHAIATKYGEAAGALSCEFFDGLAEYWQNVATGAIPYDFASADILGSHFRQPAPAIPAETPSVGDVAKTINGAKKAGLAEIPSAVGRLVKRTAEDTTLENAIRGRYEFAWIPAGDTCAFCIMLASNGWQRASKKAMKKGHAEHIHANCDCTYMVRFSKEMNVDSYDPDKYYDMYKNAEGRTPEAKVNAMRREFYQENKEEINAQKRDAYEKRKERESSAAEEIDV